VIPFREEANSPLTLYLTVKDRSLREFSGDTIKEMKEKCKLEQQVQTGPIVLMHKRKAMFLGTTDQQKPGAIQCFRYPFEKTYECQAHSLPIQAMKISYDNSTLFTVSADGTLGVFNIQDKDPKRKIKDLPSVTHSGVLLIQRTERDKILHDIEHYNQEIKAYREMAKVDAETKRAQQEKKIQELEDEIETKQIEAATK
jgi:WD40 repeat protein